MHEYFWSYPTILAPGAKRDEVSIPNSDELGSIMEARNSKQQDQSELFEESENKKRKFIPADDEDEVPYVAVSLPMLDGLIVQKAKKARDDLLVSLQADQLKMLFDFLSQEGTSCLEASKRSYSRSGKFAKPAGHKDDD